MKFRVHLRSKPGIYAQYSGYVDVDAETGDQAIERAIRKLRRTSFPDRSNKSWNVEKIQTLPKETGPEIV